MGQPIMGNLCVDMRVSGQSQRVAMRVENKTPCAQKEKAIGLQQSRGQGHGAGRDIARRTLD